VISTEAPVVRDLPAPGVTAEQAGGQGSSSALADDDDVEELGLCRVLPDERMDKLPLFLPEDELAEGFFGPDDVK
jgi:hypothetical protein